MDILPSRKASSAPSRRRTGDLWSAFDDFFNSRFADLPMANELNNFSPDVNIKENDNAYVVEAEMPGLKRDEIDIEMKSDHLVIKGEKKSFDEQEKDDYYHMERRFGSFYRSIPISGQVDESKIDAKLSDGLLTISLPKREDQPKTKKINIQ